MFDVSWLLVEAEHCLETEPDAEQFKTYPNTAQAQRSKQLEKEFEVSYQNVTSA